MDGAGAGDDEERSGRRLRRPSTTSKAGPPREPAPMMPHSSRFAGLFHGRAARKGQFPFHCARSRSVAEVSTGCSAFLPSATAFSPSAMACFVSPAAAT